MSDNKTAPDAPPPCEGAVLQWQKTPTLAFAAMPDGSTRSYWAGDKEWRYEDGPSMYTAHLAAALAAAQQQIAERDRELAELRAQADIDRRQCDDMTAEAGRMAEELREADALLRGLVDDLLPGRFQYDPNGPDVMECVTCGREGVVHYNCGKWDPSRDKPIEHSADCSLAAARAHLARKGGA